MHHVKHIFFALLIVIWLPGYSQTNGNHPKATKIESTSSFAYPAITHEQMFIYYLKAYGIHPDSPAFNPYWTSPQPTWTEGYLSLFDSHNYELAKNDEFKIQALKNSTSKSIAYKIGCASFDQVFSITDDAQSFNALGNYDFATNSFPVIVNGIGTGFRLEFLSGNNYIRLFTFKNLDDFDLNLKMSPEDASKFIDSRKDVQGTIDRKVTLKVAYKIANAQNTGSNWKELVGEIIAIEVWAVTNGTFKKLGTLQKKQ